LRGVIAHANRNVAGIANLDLVVGVCEDIHEHGDSDVFAGYIRGGGVTHLKKLSLLGVYGENWATVGRVS
jgi:hypothetical protein